MFCASKNQKKAGVTIQISDKIILKPRRVARGKKVHCIMIKIYYNIGIYTPTLEDLNI